MTPPVILVLTKLIHCCSSPKFCKGVVIEQSPGGNAKIVKWLLGNKSFDSEQDARDFAARNSITINGVVNADS